MINARERRVELLAKWRRKGGVFLISYTAFRNLSVGKNIKDRTVAREIISALQVVSTLFIPLYAVYPILHS